MPSLVVSFRRAHTSSPTPPSPPRPTLSHPAFTPALHPHAQPSLTSHRIQDKFHLTLRPEDGVGAFAASLQFDGTSGISIKQSASITIEGLEVNQYYYRFIHPSFLLSAFTIEASRWRRFIYTSTIQCSEICTLGHEKLHTEA